MTKRATDDELAEEARKWDSGELKPTDPGFVDVDPGTLPPEHMDYVRKRIQKVLEDKSTKVVVKRDDLERLLTYTEWMRLLWRVESGMGLQMAEELERADVWIDELQSGMYINCVYCGHNYGPEGDAEVSMREALYKHVAKCEKHPLFHAKQEIADLRLQLRRAKGEEHPVPCPSRKCPCADCTWRDPHDW